ncbi:MAG: metallophosphoesterase [Acidobacteria bacterium]|nr:metallophosphoesterase [Acidobacteriota bacterium]
MRHAGTQKAKLSERISSVVSSETPLRALASNLSKVARSALKEANSLKIEEVSISLRRLPKKLDGFKLVQLSDIHHSPFTDIDHIENAVNIANELKPDMFLLTGDYVSHDSRYIAPMADVLGRLDSEFGTYACLGNHDHWTDAELVTDLLRGEKINVLINEGFRFTAREASIWICGVDDHMAGKTDVPASLHGSYEDEMKLLLAHNPAILRQAVRNGIDVMFSGHTHGGQVKIRDRENRFMANRRLKSGLHYRKDTQIYITRGIGTVVVPARYHCPPEISLIELKCA